MEGYAKAFTKHQPRPKSPMKIPVDDPLGLPTVTAGKDSYIHSYMRPFVPTFENGVKIKHIITDSRPVGQAEWIIDGSFSLKTKKIPLSKLLLIHEAEPTVMAGIIVFIRSSVRTCVYQAKINKSLLKSDCWNWPSGSLMTPVMFLLFSCFTILFLLHLLLLLLIFVVVERL